MTYGLSVYNSNQTSVFDTRDVPYILTVRGAAPRLVTPPGFQGSMWGVELVNYTDNAQAAVDVRGSQYRSFGGPPTSFKGSVFIRRYSGRVFVLLSSDVNGGSMIGEQYQWVTPPKIYVMDTVRPNKVPGTYGLECYDATGNITFTSEVPLAMIEDHLQVTLGNQPAIAGPENHLCFVHNMPPYIHRLLLGSGGQTRTWFTYLQQSVSGGVHRLQRRMRTVTISVDENSDIDVPISWSCLVTLVRNPDW